MPFDKFVGTIFRYNMLGENARVGVAVSGGADSVCLLCMLVELARLQPLHLFVLHLDHCLRGAESREDAAFVQAMAARLDLSFYMETRQVAGLDPNLEQAARLARRQFYADARARFQLDRVATGHTLRDQAETVLFRLLRGSGPSGLAGIHPVTSDGLIRPLIELDRPEIEAWLRGRGIAWRDDSSNLSLQFARNRLRHEIMPQLEGAVNPQAQHALARLAAIAQEEEEYWDLVTSRQLPPGAGPLVLPVADLANAPKALARRLLRAAIARVTGPLRNITLEHVDSVVELARQQRGHGRLSLPGVDAWRSLDWLRLSRAEPKRDPDWQAEIAGPGCAAAGPVRLRIECLDMAWEPKAQTEESRYTGSRQWLDGEAVAFPLVLRNWRPGDAFQPAGRNHPQRLKQMFQASRVAAWDRVDWPVLESPRGLVWSRRFGVAAWAAAGAESQRLIRVEEVGQPACGVERGRV